MPTSEPISPFQSCYSLESASISFTFYTRPVATLMPKKLFRSTWCSPFHLALELVCGLLWLKPVGPYTMKRINTRLGEPGENNSTVPDEDKADSTPSLDDIEHTRDSSEEEEEEKSDEDKKVNFDEEQGTTTPDKEEHTSDEDEDDRVWCA